jgi:hypothetical protein
MLHVTRAEYLGGYRVHLEFNDGFVGVANLSGRLTGPVFQLLNDEVQFRQFSLTGHTLCWPNGADLAPEYLRQLAAGDLAEQLHALERAIELAPDRKSTPHAQ